MELAAYKEMVALEEHHWWFIGRRRIIDTLLSRLQLPRQARILEIGCGSGGNLRMLSRYGRVYAAEYDANARELARQRRIAERVEYCEMPNNFPFEGETFSLIVMFDVLEHIEHDVATLGVVRRHLGRDGWLVLTVPALPFLWSSHDERHHHFRRYTRSLLKKRVREAGFEPSYSGFFNFWLFPAVAAFRLAKWSRLGKGVEVPSDLKLPPPTVNRFLAWLFATERAAMNRISLPFGVSLILSARPNTGPD